MTRSPLDTSSKDALRPLLPYTPKKSRHQFLTRNILTVGAVAFFGATCFYLSHHLPSSLSTLHEPSMDTQAFWDQSSQVVAPGISLESFNYGLSQCQATRDRAGIATNETRQRHRNPRSADSGQLLIKNGHVWLQDHYLDGDILVEDGIIVKMGPNLAASHDAKVIDAAGRVVTPGIIDMHSHMTVDSFPGLEGLSDTNEMTNPTTPYVRVIDALNPSDPAIKVVSSGGVTTSLILPGSGNLMGGEAAVIKLRPVDALSVRDMLITAGVTEEDQEVVWRYMKMACGENPKAVYGNGLHKMPMTRMGENYLFRRRFTEAQALKRRQDDWCDAAARIQKTFPADKPINEDTITRLSERYPESIPLESLVALLRHHVNLNIHCYLPQDLEAMVHHSLEFDFEIAAFHHALSAWQVPEIIKRAKTNITVATFADMWGYKTEAWNQNVHAPGILDAAGIPVAFKSDHPVINSRDVIHEAQKAFHYGFDEHKALAAMTSVPARSLGLGHRIGSIAVGKDADIVIWERHPLRLGARPRTVIVDGAQLDYKASWTKLVDEIVDQDVTSAPAQEAETLEEQHYLPPRAAGTMKLEDHGMNNPLTFADACNDRTDSFVLRNIRQLYMSANQSYDASTTANGLYLVVKHGIVVCAGPDCDRDHIDWPSSSPVFDMGGAVVIPGIISTGVPLGLIEIQAEPSTWDGIASNDVDDSEIAQKVVRAADGLKLNGLHLQKAFRAGVTTSVSQPMVESDLLAGVSVAFRTGVENTRLDANDTIMNEEIALHFMISHDSKLTVSQQMASLRHLLTSNVDKDPTHNVFARAARGEIPVVVQTDDKDEMASIAHMKQQLLEQTKHSVRFIILGGASSHLVAHHLARLHIPVILMPARCFATTWSARQCLPGPPLTSDTVLDVLLRNQVLVGVASTDLDNGDARNLIWESGWNLAHNTRLTPSEAVGLVTWNIAEMFGLSRSDRQQAVGVLREENKADFVAYNGSPFDFGNKVLMVYGGGRRGPLCFPEQV